MHRTFRRNMPCLRQMLLRNWYILHLLFKLVEFFVAIIVHDLHVLEVEHRYVKRHAAETIFLFCLAILFIYRPKSLKPIFDVQNIT